MGALKVWNGIGWEYVGHDGTDSVNREKAAVTAEGMIWQTFSRANLNDSATVTDGTIYFTAIGLQANDVIAKIHVVVASEGTTMSLSKVGLYSSAGSRLAVSNDQTTSWETVGIKSISLTGSYTVTVTGGYYIALIAKGAVTPDFYCGSQSGRLTDAVNSGMAVAAVQTGQTDLISSATLTGGAASNAISIWAGVS